MFQLKSFFKIIVLFCCLATQFTASAQHGMGGTWELQGVVENGAWKASETLNNCGFKDEIWLHFNKDTISYDWCSVKGISIGKEKHTACIVHPLTYEFNMTYHSCPNTILQDFNNKSTWYSAGYPFIKYKTIRLNEVLILIEIECYNYELEMPKILFYKKLTATQREEKRNFYFKK